MWIFQHWVWLWSCCGKERSPGWTFSFFFPDLLQFSFWMLHLNRFFPILFHFVAFDLCYVTFHSVQYEKSQACQFLRTVSFLLQQWYGYSKHRMGQNEKEIIVFCRQNSLAVWHLLDQKSDWDNFCPAASILAQGEIFRHPFSHPWHQIFSHHLG